MRYLLSTCALFLLTATFIAQTPKKVENWQEFSPLSDEFTIETPLTLDQRGDNQHKTLRRFSGSMNGVFLYVFSEPSKKPNKSAQGYLDMVRDVLPQIGQSAEIIPFNSSGSGAVAFKDKFGYWHHLATLRTETRNYIVQTISLDENDGVATRFVRSFGVSQRPTFTEADLAGETVSDEVRTVPVRAAGGGQGGGIGAGSGSGISGTVPVPAALAPPAGTTSGLKVLSKPRPGYTDLARMYNIQGSVLLEVEFLATGEIGNVKALTQLPLGLTQTAIAAGKTISFQPAYENGVAVSVTKKLEYSYAIY
ncbi:MAG: energy transducer TonB [Pyrinomonadaceae bacterium]